jgi:PAS domain S-box-containing protein
MASDHLDEASADLARSRARRGRATAADEATAIEDPIRLRGLMTDEEQSRLLMTAVEDYAIISLDPSGRVNGWNEGARRIKGYEASEVLGRHFALFYPLEDIKRGRAQEELATARETGHFEEEGWRVRKGNERFWAKVTLTAVRDPEGNLRGFAKVTRDLTERERARATVARLAKVEALLQTTETARADAEAAERRLLSIISTMSDGYFTLDEQWRFSFVNSSLAKLLGTLDRDLLGASFWDAVTDSIHSNFFKYLPGLLTGGPEIEFMEFHEPTGQWLSVRAHRSGGQIVVVLRDVSAEGAASG